VPHTLETLLEAWDGEAAVVRFDRHSGTWIFIALHSSILGRPMGGTRLRQYPSPAEGLRDALRLAAGMTDKWAALDLEYGGGKAVLAVPGPLAAEVRQGLLRRYGALVESLQGAFSTGEDLGTTPEDMAVLAAETRYLHGVEDGGEVRDPGPLTAQGVFAGMEAAAGECLGRGLAGTSVLVQGVGDVGAPLAALLHQAGARLLISDIDHRRLQAAAQELGGQTVAPDAVCDTECDIFAPCAIGGVLDARAIARLRCRVVAGSANNQLENPEDAVRLHERGIVYVPDFVINAGGALAFALHGRGERDPRSLMAQMARVGVAVAEVLQEARTAGEPPLAAARRRVDRILARGRRQQELAGKNPRVAGATPSATSPTL
jgi:leucine dehydrogenase